MRKPILLMLFLLLLIGLSKSKSKRKRNKELNRGLLGELVTQNDVNMMLNMAANSPNLKNLIDRVLARGTNNNVIDFKKLNTLATNFVSEKNFSVVLNALFHRISQIYKESFFNQMFTLIYRKNFEEALRTVVKAIFDISAYDVDVKPEIKKTEL